MPDLWEGVQWKAFDTEDATGALPRHQPDLIWTKSRVPYVREANALQTVDIWASEQHFSKPKPNASAFPTGKGVWLIYIHGGAWRDPAITSQSFVPTIKYLIKSKPVLTQIIGIASINYSLSPYPNHADDPSPPHDPSEASDPSRIATHPDHVRDVLNALNFLQLVAGFGTSYILVGHSCGATLALQAIMDHRRWMDKLTRSLQKPRHVLGLNGLYDLPDLVHNLGPRHQNIAHIYKAFLTSAFGKAEDEWIRASPSNIQNWAEEWPEGLRIALAQSKEDSLVPYEQTESMLGVLRRSSGTHMDVSQETLLGDHDLVWQHGERLAGIICKLVHTLRGP